MKDLYSENYKIFIKEIQDDTKKWKDVLVLEELILLKWLYYPKQSTDVMQSLSKAHDIFHRTRTNCHKIHMKPQKIENIQCNLENKERSWEYHLSCL